MTEEVYVLGDALLGPLSKRPAAAAEVRWFIDKDTGIAYLSDGTTWLQSSGSSLPGITSNGTNGVVVAGNETVGGTLGVTGATTVSTLHATGAATLSSTLAVTGAANLGGATSFGGRIIGNNTSVPTLGLAAGAGTTPPAAVLGAGGNDTGGTITFGTGTAPAAGDQVTVTFGTAYPSAPRSVAVTAANSATAAIAPFYVASITTTGFTVGLAGTPAGSQANTVYAFTYLVIQ